MKYYFHIVFFLILFMLILRLFRILLTNNKSNFNNNALENNSQDVNLQKIQESFDEGFSENEEKSFVKRYIYAVLFLLLLPLTLIFYHIFPIVALLIAIFTEVISFYPKLIFKEFYQSVTLTFRSIILLILGSTLVFLVPNQHIYAILTIGLYNIFLMMMIMYDYNSTPKYNDIKISREFSKTMSIGKENKVSLIVENYSNKELYMFVVDEIAEYYTPDNNLILLIPPKSYIIADYKIVPKSRGVFSFRTIKVCYRSVYNLIELNYEYIIPAVLEVYPDILSLQKFLFKHQRSMQLDFGVIIRRKRGIGTEFESLREYLKGDDYKRIDWKASARRNRIISKDFQVEVNQSVLIAIDCSRTMGYRIEGIEVLDYVLNSLILFGKEVIKNGDKVGFISFSDTIKNYLPPAKSKIHFYNFIKNLNKTFVHNVEANYTALFEFILQKNLKRTLLIFIFDATSFSLCEEKIFTVLAKFNKHLIVLISIADPIVFYNAEKILSHNLDIYRKVISLDLIKKLRLSQKKIEKLGINNFIIQPNAILKTLFNAYYRNKLSQRL